MRVAIGCVIVLALVFSVGKAEACTCPSSGPPCQNVFQVDAVFVGTVQTISEIEHTPDSPYRRRRVVLAIERAFRGVQGTTAEVVTGMGGGDCGFAFKVAARYLVYAYRSRDDGMLTTGICTRTRTIGEASEDLQYLESLPPSGTGGRVYGTLKHWERDLASRNPKQYGPVPFTHVLLRGPGVGRDTQTDDGGRYEIAGLPIGTYDLQVIPSPEFSARYLQRTIALPDTRACSVEDFSLRYDGHVSGTVLGFDGAAIAGLLVELIAASRANSNDLIEVLTTETTVGGFFEFTEVPPGRYVVGISLRRRETPILYPRTFHPGTAIASEATIVTIGEGNHQPLVDPLRLPPPRTSRETVGRVIWPDGRPVSGAGVSLQDGTASWQQLGGAIKTDSDGRFSFVVHDGLSYLIHAWYGAQIDSQWRQVQASAGPFAINGPMASLTIVLPPLPVR
jgi:hypothetical protein